MSEETIVAPPRPGLFAALCIRDFALLWSGQSVSNLGDGIFTVALAIETLRVGHSGSSLGLVLAARAIPSLAFVLIGGAIVDRIPRRFAMLSSDLVRGCLVGTIALLAGSGALRIWMLITISLAFGCADALFSPASASIVPELLPEELLVQGNSLGFASGQLAQALAGPALGGVIVALAGTAWAFGVDAASFCVSVVCLLAIRTTTKAAASGKSILSDIGAGIHFILERRWLLLNLVAGGLANLFGLAPILVLVPLLVRVVLHGSSSDLGLVLGAGGAGGLVASLLLSKLKPPRRKVLTMWIAYGGSLVPLLVMIFSPYVWLVGLGNAAVFGLFAYGDIIYISMMQASIPAEMRGRTFAVLQLLAFGLTPIGTAASGYLAQVFGIRRVFLITTLIACATFFVIFIPGARDPDKMTATELAGADQRPNASPGGA